MSKKYCYLFTEGNACLLYTSEDGREVAPGVMLDHHGKEVLK